MIGYLGIYRVEEERGYKYLTKETADNLKFEEVRSQYNKVCRNILMNRYVLAWIMKHAIKEYGHLSIDFIRRCILSTSDLQCTAFMPKEGKNVKLLLNLEGKNQFKSGYPLISEGVNEGLQKVSWQNGVKQREKKDEHMKKIYSIWICVNAPRKMGNTISVYELIKKDHVLEKTERRKNYEKLTVILVCLNGECYSRKGFFDLMNTLFSPTIDYDMKKKILRNDYRILMDEIFEEALSVMCDLAEWVLDKGEQRGIDRGIEQGIEMAKRRIAENLLKQQILNDEQIMRAVEISKNQFLDIKFSEKERYGIED